MVADMVDTVERDLLMLNLGVLDIAVATEVTEADMVVTEADMEDTVVHMEVMVDAAVMVDTVERDLLMLMLNLGVLDIAVDTEVTEADMVAMEVVEVTEVDMEVTVVDMEVVEDMDMESNRFPFLSPQTALF
jgi:hypothetical protein